MKKDTKGRVLNKGEDQLNDGRYRFRYTTENGIRRDIYSWKLLPTDRTPKGKRDSLSLREKEKQIILDTSAGISTYEAERITVSELINRYWKQCNFKTNTLQTYTTLRNKHIDPVIGKIKIYNVKPSTIRKYYCSLADDYSISTLETINAIIFPAFDMAVRDGLIRTNPAIGATKGLSKRTKETDNKKRALTLEEQKAFIGFVAKEYQFWLPFFTVAIQTGMRIGELTALTWKDCNFDNETIEINKTLLYNNNGKGAYTFIINSPKTESGNRTIKMFPAVKKALQEQRIRGIDSHTVDGYSGFVFTTPQKELITKTYINRLLKKIVKEYNEEQNNITDPNSRISLPSNITTHWLRYTCCTRFCENVSSIDEVKSVSQYLGHKNISITLEVYMSVSPKKENDLQKRVQQNAFA